MTKSNDGVVYFIYCVESSILSEERYFTDDDWEDQTLARELLLEYYLIDSDGEEALFIYTTVPFKIPLSYPMAEPPIPALTI